MDTPFGTKAMAGSRYNRGTVGYDQHSAANRSSHHAHGEFERFTSSPEFTQYDDEDDQTQSPSLQIPLHAKRTLFITNLPERTTHKDLVSVVRGGRLLDIFLRHDRSATVAFVEGAAEFLAYAKRNDIYLHTKRVSQTLFIIQCQTNLASLSSAGTIDSFTFRPTCLPRSQTGPLEISWYGALQESSQQTRSETS